MSGLPAGLLGVAAAQFCLAVALGHAFYFGGIEFEAVVFEHRVNDLAHQVGQAESQGGAGEIFDDRNE